MQLQCPDVESTLDEDGGRYKTEKMDKMAALQLLNLHVQHSWTTFARQKCRALHSNSLAMAVQPSRRRSLSPP